MFPVKRLFLWIYSYKVKLGGLILLLFLATTLVFKLNPNQAVSAKPLPVTLSATRKRFFDSLAKDFFLILSLNQALIFKLAPLPKELVASKLQIKILFKTPDPKIFALKQLARIPNLTDAFLRTTLKAFWNQIRVYTFPQEYKLEQLIDKLFALLSKIQHDLDQFITKINAVLKINDFKQTDSILNQGQKMMNRNLSQILSNLHQLFFYLDWVLEHPGVLNFKKIILWTNLEKWAQTNKKELAKIRALHSN